MEHSIKNPHFPLNFLNFSVNDCKPMSGWFKQRHNLKNKTKNTKIFKQQTHKRNNLKNLLLKHKTLITNKLLAFNLCAFIISDEYIYFYSV